MTPHTIQVKKTNTKKKKQWDTNNMLTNEIYRGLIKCKAVLAGIDTKYTAFVIIFNDNGTHFNRAKCIR